MVSRLAPCWHFFCARLASPQGMRASKSTCLFGRAPSASRNLLSAQAIEIWVKFMKSSVDGYSLLNASASISSQASNMNQERRWTFYIVYQMKRRSWGQTPYVLLSTFASQQSVTCLKRTISCKEKMSRRRSDIKVHRKFALKTSKLSIVWLKCSAFSNGTLFHQY